MLDKNLKYYKDLDYNIIIEKQEYEDEIWYIAYANELGKFACYGKGDTEIEALNSFKEEKDVFIEYLFNSKKEIPEPNNSIENVEKEYSGKFNVRTSSIIHYELVKQAKDLNISLNLYLNQILSSAVQNKKIENVINNKLDEITKKIDQHHFEITKQIKFQNDNLYIKLKWDASYSNNPYELTA